MEVSSRFHLLGSSCCLVLLMAMHAKLAVASASLEVGFYGYTCPLAESIVRNTVRIAVAQDSGIAAALIRMHFHDCFVRGCDASILLDSTTGNPAEKEARPNNPSLRGFDVIDQAKAALEALCPGTVSCADVVAFAARDGAYEAGGVYYEVPSGRRDGRISSESEVALANNIPPPIFTAEQLRDNFAAKGLSLEDMVVLSGAHSVGVSHCSSFDRRLRSFNSTHPQDPSLDGGLASHLRRRCPSGRTSTGGGGVGDPTVPLDPATPLLLDNRYYKNLRRHRGVLVSDQALQASPLTAGLVRAYARHGSSWAAKFGEAMVRMGSVEVLTGNEGEIRRNCRVVN
ncbi:hypothetical protein Taro_051512 [Colocasia esculenta]|uniref:Peroxidase n=1 Tax=Colocasia esculenta TaxID=4460 RepID=A0A843XG51_COLES|nr:hypothetical protein [Colocasia esculenta]